MLHFELLRDRGLLIIHPDGPLEKSDFTSLASEIDPFIDANGRLTGVMIYTKSFPGWDDFAAFVSHLRFVADHHRKVERIAVVTDGELLKILPRLLITLFKRRSNSLGLIKRNKP